MRENSSSQGAVAQPEAESRAGKHSPAPWAVCKAETGGCKCGFIFDATGDVHVATAFDREALGEDYYASDVAPSPSTRAANAHLIAAAPDLYEALRLCRRLIDEALPKFDWGRSCLDANAIALLNEAPIAVRAALALAEGRPPESGTDAPTTPGMHSK